MKRNNLIALILGLFAAALLWEYYLKPKYNIRRADEATLSALALADALALDEAEAEVGGELLTRSDEFTGEEPAKDDVLAARSPEPEEFDFHSSANRPRTLAEIAAAGDKRRNTQIVLDDAILIADGEIAHTMPDGYAAEELVETDDGAIISPDAKSRFTLLIAPAKFNIVRARADYAKLLGKALPKYPAVDFGKDMIILLESDGQLANGFYQIDSVQADGPEIIINYKVNIIGSGERLDTMAHHVMPSTDKPITLRQVK